MTTKMGAIDSGKTSEYGHNKLLSRLLDQSGVLSWLELRVKAADTPDNTVKVTVGDGVIGNLNPSASSYLYPVYVTAEESVTITANISGQARVDSIVAYIDKSAVTDTDDDNPGVLKFKDVLGTPAGSPTAPNAAAIVASIGSGNPYMVLANIAVANSFVTITDANITDQRTLVSSVVIGNGFTPLSALTRTADTTATLVGDWTNRVSIGNRIKWLSNLVERANWVKNITFDSATSLSTITLLHDTTAEKFVNGETITLPSFSKFENTNELGYAEVTTSQTTITSVADLTNLTCAVIVPSGKNIEIEGYITYIDDTANDEISFQIKEGSTVLRTTYDYSVANASKGICGKRELVGVTPGAHTYKLALGRTSGSGTMTMQAGATYRAFISVKAV